MASQIQEKCVVGYKDSLGPFLRLLGLEDTRLITNIKINLPAGACAKVVVTKLIEPLDENFTEVKQEYKLVPIGEEIKTEST